MKEVIKTKTKQAISISHPPLHDFVSNRDPPQRERFSVTVISLVRVGYMYVPSCLSDLQTVLRSDASLEIWRLLAAADVIRWQRHLESLHLTSKLIP